MPKPLSKSRELAGRLLHAALTAVKNAGGRCNVQFVYEQVLNTVELDEWAKEIIESNGLPRWQTYLQFFSIDAVKANFLIKERGVWTLTPEGEKELDKPPAELLDVATAAFRAWKRSQTPKPITPIDNDDQLEEVDEPPEDRMFAIQQEVHERLSFDLIEMIKSCSPSFFERLVVELLLKMGYGGTRADAGRAIGQSGDGGIDGIIDEDRLGLDSIYIQAKKWEAAIGRPEIQKFVGALQGQRAHKGVFITTSDFTREAREYVNNINTKVVLVNGFSLARLMIENNVGVSVAATYSVKKIDTDYFLDE